MTDPRQPPSTPEAPEPGTARALWPTFMRRTLPVEDVADASPEPDRRRPDERSAEKTLDV